MKWPVNFMLQPNAFPYRITNQLGTYAATHMESVQKGVLQVTRAVKQFQKERGPPPPLEVEMPDDVPEGKEENPPANALVAQLKESLLKAIREELPARFVPPPPPAPVPVEVTVVTESGPGGTARWAFGLALSLWVVYNMN